MRVRFTPQADRQYLGALAYLQAKNPAGALTVMRRAEAVIAQLREHPHSGHAIPEYPDLPHRELPAPPYRFFYRVVDDTVWIVAVWHARQLPEEPDDVARG
ncbi:MAG: type II toxin-antitoxin system RelE/ParE family toxin [Anaerosomatales bacterium]|nr:type II toxin-antitoxin system RelE/ParE family toxin [Coriobacteriia bacterium]